MMLLTKNRNVCKFLNLKSSTSFHIFYNCSGDKVAIFFHSKEYLVANFFYSKGYPDHFSRLHPIFELNYQSLFGLRHVNFEILNLKFWQNVSNKLVLKVRKY